MALTQISTDGIKNGTITNADLASNAAIDGSKINTATFNQSIVTSSNQIRVNKTGSTAVDGFMGEAYSNYFGLKHTDQTLNSEYMIVSNDTHTFISASTGSNVYIRAGGNSSDYQLIVGAGNSALTWRGFKVWHENNDGAGSGLDADTLDGISSGQFLRSDASDSYNCVGNALAFNFDTNNRNSITFTLNGSVYWQFLHDNGGADLNIDRVAGGGNLKVNGYRILSTADEGSGQGLDSDTVDGIEANQFLRKDTTSTFNCNGNALNFDFDNVGRNSLAFTLNGSTYWQFVHDNGGQDLNIDRNAGSGIVKIDGNKVFHAGNDGAGSGLDADTLDGQEGSYYTNAANLTGTLPAIDGSNLTGITSTTIVNNANDRIVTASGTANTLNSEIQLTFNGSTMSIGSGSSDEKLKLFGTNPYIRFLEGSTEKAYIQWVNSGIFQFVNQESGEYLRIKSGSNGLTFTVDGSEKTVWHSGNDGSGSGLDADTLDGVNGANYVRTNQNTTVTSDLFIGGGAGGLTVNAASDIRFTNGNWTGNVSGNTAKIQHHSNYLYISGGSNGIIFRENNDNRWLVDGSGHFRPGVNNTYDLGTTSQRVRNIYTNDLHLSNEGSSNDVDGTWGSYTIQEGADDLFLINKRNGKKYKFNLTEIS